ncbi:hypothetical protein GB927_000050 [Shinella sp. CPCC 100929]|uniref:Uncharacterized protein n=1 Tax=Shinella lacus TaxID=2654216 RepID=A0ABT1QZP3_9HYPH|nr:hypothetical protein [Shinella lacus]MCQ4628401.1 hypothetical protein [Shinella lacus]
MATTEQKIARRPIKKSFGAYLASKMAENTAGLIAEQRQSTTENTKARANILHFFQKNRTG